MTALPHLTAALSPPAETGRCSPADRVRKSAVLFRTSPLLLDCGRPLSDVRVAYHTYGAAREEATLVLHALTGNSAVHEWWPDFLGAGQPLDPARDFIICANVLGGCAGTDGPAEWQGTGLDALPISLRDMARVGRALLEHLGVRRVRIIGASMGGLLAYAWLLECPDLVARAVVIGAPTRHSPWAVGLNSAARAAIRAAPGGEGLKVARMVAMLSYRSPQSLAQTQAGQRRPGVHAVTSYLEYQGEKLLARFCESSYVTLTGAMDGFQPNSAELASIHVPVLVVGISSDMLYPAAEVQAGAAELPSATYWELDSIHGHDAFLMDAGELLGRVGTFLRGGGTGN